MVIFRKRRTQLAGHLIRHEEEVANKLVLWQPTDGRPSRGRKRRTYIQNLLEDTGTENVNEIINLMKDRNTWKDRVKESLGSTYRSANQTNLEITQSNLGSYL